MKNTALLIVDVQNYFINERSETTIPKIKKYIQKNPSLKTAFTYFINKKKSPFYTQLKRKKCMQKPHTTIANSLQEYSNSENTFSKTSYSAFQSPMLIERLATNKIQNIQLCWFDTDSCILWTAFQWFDQGYQITTITNLCASHRWPIYHHNAIQMLRKNFPVLTINEETYLPR